MKELVFRYKISDEKAMCIILHLSKHGFLILPLPYGTFCQGPHKIYDITGKIDDVSKALMSIQFFEPKVISWTPSIGLLGSTLQLVMWHSLLLDFIRGWMNPSPLKHQKAQ